MARRRIRVLFDANPLLVQKTGVGHYTYRLVQALAGHHDLELIGYYSGALGDAALPEGISYRRLPVPKKIINQLRRMRLLPPIELLTGRRADFLFFPDFLGLPSLFRTPRACVIHDLTFLDLPEYVSRRNQRDLAHFVPREVARSRFVVTVSEFSKQRLRDAYGLKEDILVTPVPPEAPLPADTKADQKTLQQLGIDGKYILTLGTIEPRKNLVSMLEAYVALPAKVREEYAFVVAGKVGWNCEAEIAKLQELKDAGYRICQIGYVDDRQRAVLYRYASLFTMASRYEGFGMQALEAMSYGTACAVSDIPVFREVSGDAAVYFEGGRPEAITKAWLRLLQNDTYRKKLVAAGRQRVAGYDWSTVASSLHDRIIGSLGN